MTRRKIFIRNLPAHCNVDELREAFCQFGPIEDCAVVADARGRSRGFAFITYATQEGAVKASAEPQQTFGGRVIFVSIAKSCTRQAGMQKPVKGASPQRSQMMGGYGGPRDNILFDPWTDSTAPSAEHLFDLIGGHARGGEFGVDDIHASDPLAPYALYPISAVAAAAAYNLITQPTADRAGRPDAFTAVSLCGSERT